MRLTREMKDQIRERYEKDFEEYSGSRVKNYKSAGYQMKEMRETIEARMRNGRALPASPKRQCAALLHFYRNTHNMGNHKSLEQKKKQIISMDMIYLEECPHAERFVSYILRNPQINLVSIAITELYKTYLANSEKDLKKAIRERVQTDAEIEYTQALAMERKFILHIGGTNSGKTYESVERLKKAKCGVYAGPLRLLALEIYDKLTASEVPCSMITGEERVLCEDSRVYSCTAEMVDLEQEYDIAVIDEAQMISDPFRGDAWSRLIMGVKAKEVHVCMAPEAASIIRRILKRCNIKFEEVKHVRNTELVFEEKPFELDLDLQKGDALILFSKKMVLDVAARLEMQGVKASVIYGNLPPQIRKKQFEMFLQGENEVVVATDAIGLGVNLPIRRIIFMEHMKYDGKELRRLNEYEVRQIAGRAGRRGMYDVGYVAATTPSAIEHIKKVYQMNHQIQYAIIGFPQVLLDLDQPLDEILNSWYQIKPTLDVYRKIDIKELLIKYRSLEHIRDGIQYFDDKRELYNMISVDVDLKNEQCMTMWRAYCKSYTADVCLRFPSYEKVKGATTLERAETYYKLLDLYHQFSIRFGKIADSEKVHRERLKTEEIILAELGKSKSVYLRKCSQCGKLLPIGTKSSLCDKCYYTVTGREKRG